MWVYLGTPSSSSPPHYLMVLLLTGPHMAECHPPRQQTKSRASHLCIPSTAPPLEKGPSWPNVAPASPGKMGVRSQHPQWLLSQTGVSPQLGQHSLRLPPHAPTPNSHSLGLAECVVQNHSLEKRGSQTRAQSPSLPYDGDTGAQGGGEPPMAIQALAGPPDRPPFHALP